MDKQKRNTLIIVTIVAVVIVIISLVLITNNANNNPSSEGSPSIDNTSSSSEESDPSNIIPDEDMEESADWLFDFFASDPIYKFMPDTYYEADMYTISMSVDENRDVVLNILINTSEPTTANGKVTTAQYEEQALQQIRDWGIDPNNYIINIGYRY